MRGDDERGRLRADRRRGARCRYAPRDRRAPGGARYAPWWQRVSAFLIDVSARADGDPHGRDARSSCSPVSVDTDVSHTRGAAARPGAARRPALVVGAAYAIVLEGRSGQTLGQAGARARRGRRGRLAVRLRPRDVARAARADPDRGHLAGCSSCSRGCSSYLGGALGSRSARPGTTGSARRSSCASSAPRGQPRSLTRVAERAHTDAVISASRSLDVARIRASWWWTSGRGVVGR